jgi:hypothetical protein
MGVGSSFKYLKELGGESIFICDIMRLSKENMKEELRESGWLDKRCSPDHQNCVIMDWPLVSKLASQDF